MLREGRDILQLIAQLSRRVELEGLDFGEVTAPGFASIWFARAGHPHLRNRRARRYFVALTVTIPKQAAGADVGVLAIEPKASSWRSRPSA